MFRWVLELWNEWGYRRHEHHLQHAAATVEAIMDVIQRHTPHFV